MKKQLHIPFLLLASILYFSTASAQYASLDTTFGNQGIVITSLDRYTYGACMALQPDGRILVSGYASHGDTSSAAVIRYLTNGSPDSTFGTNGVVETTLSLFWGGVGISGMALQADGKIVCAGTKVDSLTNSYLVVLRYDSNGLLDSTFGVNGIVVDTFVTGGDAVAIQADGKIVIGGLSGNSNFGVLRYLSNGTLDHSFGTNGRVLSITGSSSIDIYSIALQSTGKIVIAGNSGPDFSFARFDATGVLDTTFGNNGETLIGDGVNYYSAYAITVLSDDKIMAAGAGGSGGMEGATLMRLTADGALDTPSFAQTFDGGLSAFVNKNYAVAITQTGQIIAAGLEEWGSNYDFNLSRYYPDGKADTSFAPYDNLQTDVTNSNNSIQGLAIQPDGKIIAAGYADNGAGRFQIAVARYLPGGAPVVPLIASIVSTYPTCYGDSNGTITVTVSGGTPPYTYLLSGGSSQASDTFTGLPAGSYTIVVSDSVNDLLTLTDTLIQPAPVQVTLSWDSLVKAHDLGVLWNTDTAWGTDCFQYQLPQVFPLVGGSPSGGTYSGQYISNDTVNFQSWNFNTFMDTITYTYTNINGCSASVIDSFLVTWCEGINTIPGEATISLYPNPNNGSFVLQSSDAIGKEYIITDMLGRVVAQQTITSNNQNIQLQNISAGSYMLSVKGNNSKAVRFAVE